MSEKRIDEEKVKPTPRIEMDSCNEDKIILKDNIKNKTFDMIKKEEQLYCELCKKIDCVHIGYVFGLPNVYEILNSMGIKNLK